MLKGKKRFKFGKGIEKVTCQMNPVEMGTVAAGGSLVYHSSVASFLRVTPGAATDCTLVWLWLKLWVNRLENTTRYASYRSRMRSPNGPPYKCARSSPSVIRLLIRRVEEKTCASAGRPNLAATVSGAFCTNTLTASQKTGDSTMFSYSYS
jgi:hypothetical protein